MTRSGWLAQAAALVDRLQDGEDAEVALSGDVDLLIARLREVLRPGPGVLEIFQALGWLHWYRHWAHMKHDRYSEADAEEALAHRYLEPVYRADPLAVPKEMEHLFARRVRRDAPEPSKKLYAAWRMLEDITAHQDIGTLTRKTEEIRRLLEVPGSVSEYAGLSAFVLGCALHQESAHSGDREAELLDEAVACFRRAREWQRVSSAEPLLGEALLRLFRLRGDRQDLSSAVTHLRSAVGGSTAEQSDFSLQWLAAALYEQHRLGVLGDEEQAEAITAARRSLAPGGAPEARGHRMQLLATLLRIRGRRTGDIGSLDEAVQVAREAVAHTTDPERGVCLHTLGQALRAHFLVSGTWSFIDEAIDVFRQALAHPDHTDENRVLMLADLAGALVERYGVPGPHADRESSVARVDEAIALWREALASTRDGTDRGLLWGNLGGGLRTRHTLDPDPRTLDETIDAYRRALDEPHSLRDWSEAHGWQQLGNALADRYEARHDPCDHAEALLASRRAAHAPDADPEQRLSAAIMWGNRAAGREDWDEALKGFRAAIDALPHMASPALHRSDQERKLWGSFRVASAAAATALLAGDDRADEALELLEAGRGILFRSVLRAGDAQFSSLTTAAPDLAAELSAVESELTGGRLSLDRRHDLAARWNTTVESVRRRPGFERFLLPPTAAEARAAASGGPVITVNVSEPRCDALILTGTEIKVVPLAALRFDDLAERCERFSDALSVAESGAAGLVSSLTAQETLRETLAWLWDVVAEPVLTALELTGPVTENEPLPRVWWSPTGPLSRLPLHAAGHHEPGGPSVLGLVVSSYTPTVRTLIGARNRAPRVSPPPPRILAVGLSDTPGYAPLTATLQEAASLADPERPPLLDGHATRRTVLDSLSECDWAHFACHAHPDEEYASGSRLILHDQPVTVTDIDRLRLHHAELVYLSACSTAAAPESLAAESLHLGSAFQLAGFRHVIATLWNVQDGAAAQIAHSFYERLPRQAALPSDAAARALHHAVRHARDREPFLPSRWAAHYHTGP
ncbi:CHAT domain-containing protein [Streptomyces sp. ISID311]|uniref:CHAT domain-containing protein n=1 Tax=Streptomyces sp. ISID311 TaxID=2601673 RepID=UPI0011BD4353|nr:CHAT domain-containing protein [Streptomyces sp. ISID311]TXC97442.1 CHAT domain-containing protein [Streptomyces sp. ISID311]